MRRLAILAATGAVFGAASAAQAAGAPLVVFPPTEIGLQVGGTFTFGPGILSIGNDEAIGNLTAAGPSVTAEGTTAPPGFTSQLVDVTADWDFKVIGGPVGLNNVGIVINGLYSAAGHGGATVANVFVGPNFSEFSNLYTRDCVNGGVDCVTQPFSINTTVTSNEVEEIRLHVGGVVTGGVGSSFSVTLDPTISLAPGFADQGYQLLVAPDAQPPTGVPEPAAWALMIVGFGLTGASVRRRRAAMRPAA